MTVAQAVETCDDGAQEGVWEMQFRGWLEAQRCQHRPRVIPSFLSVICDHVGLFSQLIASLLPDGSHSSKHHISYNLPVTATL